MLGRQAIALMNTDLPGRPDLLDGPVWLTEALTDWSIARNSPVRPADLQVMRQTRAVLRGLTTRVAGGVQLTRSDLAAFNEIIGSIPVRAEIQPDGDGYSLEMTPVAKAWRDRALREVTGSFAAMLRQDPSRLRICARPGCETVFWDDTRSRTRAWCDNRTCGNRMRVNRHRRLSGSSP